MYNCTKRNNTHRYILHVAKSLFEQYGIKDVTVDRIAEACGICRSTFFTHFASINQLLLEMADAETDDLIAVEGDLHGIQLIKAVLCKMVDDTILYPGLYTTLMSMRIASNDKGSLRKVEQLLERGILECGKVDADYCVSLILGVYFGFVNHYMIGDMDFGDGSDIKAKISAAIEAIMRSNF